MKGLDPPARNRTAHRHAEHVVGISDHRHRRLTGGNFLRPFCGEMDFADKGHLRIFTLERARDPRAPCSLLSVAEGSVRSWSHVLVFGDVMK